MSAYNMQIDLY